MMETNTINLGGALVYLPIAAKYSSPETAAADDAYVRHIQKRYRELNRNGNLPLILEKLPEHSCLINKPFLADNEDFFIALFSDTKHDEACVRLYRHMNDCYPCFEIFSQVLRDYYSQGETRQHSQGDQ